MARVCGGGGSVGMTIAFDNIDDIDVKTLVRVYMLLTNDITLHSDDMVASIWFLVDCMAEQGQPIFREERYEQFFEQMKEARKIASKSDAHDQRPAD
jgi:hypothetical protein